ncbi:MAG TPA: hypothetical protein PLK37_02820 [Terricaulis sp.]|nr:hypothetical protein [Terricaulis sp.]
MAKLDLEASVRVEGGDVWIKATPGRLNAFLSKHFGFGNVAPQSEGAAQDFLEVLLFAAEKVKPR